MTSLEIKKIKKLMIDKDLTCAEMARRLGFVRQAVIGVVNGHWASRRVQKALAEALEVPYEELWGKEEEKAA